MSTTQFKKGHDVPTEWRDISSNSNKGRKHTEETKKKISESMVGEKNHEWKNGSEAYYRRIARKKIHGSIKSPNTNLVVHHIDRDITNNSLVNLQVLSRSEHTRLHWQERLT